MELVKKSSKVEKNGEIKNYTNYYLKLDNGNWLAIKPAFLNDYKLLYVLAKDATNEAK